MRWRRSTARFRASPGRVRTPLLDDRAADAAKRLAAYGHAVTVVSPDMTGGDSPGRTVERIDRRPATTPFEEQLECRLDAHGTARESPHSCNGAVGMTALDNRPAASSAALTGTVAVLVSLVLGLAVVDPIPVLAGFGGGLCIAAGVWALRSEARERIAGGSILIVSAQACSWDRATGD